MIDFAVFNLFQKMKRNKIYNVAGFQGLVRHHKAINTIAVPAKRVKRKAIGIRIRARDLLRTEMFKRLFVKSIFS